MNQYKEIYFEDIDKGSAFWESIFRRVVDIEPFQEPINATEVIDLDKINVLTTTSTKSEDIDFDNDMNCMEINDEEREVQEEDRDDDRESSIIYDNNNNDLSLQSSSMPIIASMEIGDLELNASNISYIHNVLGKRCRYNTLFIVLVLRRTKVKCTTSVQLMIN